MAASPEHDLRAPLTGAWASRPDAQDPPMLTLRPAPEAVRAGRVDDPDVPAQPRQIEIGDARWSLAVATHARMTGTMVRPEDRETLVRMGRSMGLDAFASNLVIAVVQDQARRGRGPAGGIDQLLMIAAPGRAAHRDKRRGWAIAGWVAAAIVVEAAVVWMMW